MFPIQYNILLAKNLSCRFYDNLLIFEVKTLVLLRIRDYRDFPFNNFFNNLRAKTPDPFSNSCFFIFGGKREISHLNLVINALEGRI